jgi:hypothetical protein
MMEIDNFPRYEKAKEEKKLNAWQLYSRL